jgi:hypothetical protein
VLDLCLNYSLHMLIFKRIFIDLWSVIIGGVSTCIGANMHLVILIATPSLLVYRACANFFAFSIYMALPCHRCTKICKICMRTVGKCAIKFCMQTCTRFAKGGSIKWEVLVLPHVEVLQCNHLQSKVLGDSRALL